MTETKPIDAEQMLEMLKPEALEIIKAIESRPPTTLGWYGDYLHIISRVAEESRSMAQLLMVALLRAGANRDGMRAAASIAGVVDK